MDKEESGLEKWRLVLSAVCHLAKIGAWIYCIKIICEHIILLADAPASLEIIMTNINKFEISTKISVGTSAILALSLLGCKYIIQYLKKENDWLKEQLNKKDQ